METLYGDILNMLGLEVKPDGRIYDTDAFDYLIYNGGFIYMSKPELLHKKDTPFNPIENPKLANYLLNVLIKKESQDNSLYIVTIGSEAEPARPTDKMIRYRACISSNQGDFRSEYFYLQSLQHIQLMYMITGTPMMVDLKQFDLTKEQIEARLDTKKG